MEVFLLGGVILLHSKPEGQHQKQHLCIIKTHYKAQDYQQEMWSLSPVAKSKFLICKFHESEIDDFSCSIRHSSHDWRERERARDLIHLPEFSGISHGSWWALDPGLPGVFPLNKDFSSNFLTHSRSLKCSVCCTPTKGQGVNMLT